MSKEIINKPSVDNKPSNHLKFESGEKVLQYVVKKLMDKFAELTDGEFENELHDFTTLFIIDDLRKIIRAKYDMEHDYVNKSGRHYNEKELFNETCTKFIEDDFCEGISSDDAIMSTSTTVYRRMRDMGYTEVAFSMIYMDLNELMRVIINHVTKCGNYDQIDKMVDALIVCLRHELGHVLSNIKRFEYIPYDEFKNLANNDNGQTTAVMNGIRDNNLQGDERLMRYHTACEPEALANKAAGITAEEITKATVYLYY